MKDNKEKREKCSYADKYQAKVKPKCGCIACETKWMHKEKTQIIIDKTKQFYKEAADNDMTPHQYALSKPVMSRVKYPDFISKGLIGLSGFTNEVED